MNFVKNRKMKSNISTRFVCFVDKTFSKCVHRFQLILNAKCHAIRDAQVLEKQQIKKEIDQENKRLDMMMEIERLNALKIQEEIEKRRHEQAKESVSLTDLTVRRSDSLCFLEGRQ